MDTLETELMNLIMDFQNSVKEAMVLISAKEFGPEERDGFLDNKHEIKFMFHGRGCLVKFKNYKVDFDFSFNNKGFSPWFLALYKKQFPNKYPNLKDLDHFGIGDLVKGLVKEGKIVYPEGGLWDYFLKEDWIPFEDRPEDK